MCLLYRNTYFKERILVAISTVCFFKKIFLSHLTQNILKCVNKAIGVIRELQNGLPRDTCLIRIYKSFLGSHIDSGNLTYDQTCNFAFHSILKSCQYNVVLAITGAISISNSISIFRKTLLNLFCPAPSITSSCNNTNSLSYMARLRLDLGQLWDQKLQFSFQVTLNPFLGFWIRSSNVGRPFTSISSNRNERITLYIIEFFLYSKDYSTK